MQSANGLKTPPPPFERPPPSERSDEPASGEQRRATLDGLCHPSESGGEPGDDAKMVGDDLCGEDEGGSDVGSEEEAGSEPRADCREPLTGVTAVRSWRTLEVTSHGPNFN